MCEIHRCVQLLACGGHITIGNGCSIHLVPECGGMDWSKRVEDVWLGPFVMVLDGVSIAKACVIRAGSMVKKSTEPYGVCVGNPARFIKFRGDCLVCRN